MYRILIIEDDDIIAKNIATHFKRWNYETMQIIDFKNIMEEFLKFDPQLVLLDIGLVSGNTQNLKSTDSFSVINE